ncbi:MAG: Gfo/Idh/MocA family oxidoreductase [Planctomycetota bacterium]
MSRARLSRRSFLQTSAAFAAAPLLPRWSATLETRPLETLSVACVGTGGMGGADLAAVARCPNVRIAALCDVDQARLAAAAAEHPDARTFADWRALFDTLGRDLDAVVVSTPDHMHGPIAIAALRRGLHVYCQKPLAHNLHECRRMTELAAAGGLVTQMGTQIHAHPAYRTAVHMLRSGAIGLVREVHAWVAKSWAGPAGGRPDRSDPVPAGLDWDLWLGAAPARPFVEGAYHPAQWRGWLDFGTGTLGDMGCHILDPVFTALELGAPTTVLSRGPQHGHETFAADGDVVWTFAPTARTAGALRLHWTDGGAHPEAARAHLPPGVELPRAGSFTIGERGVMVLPHWAMPTFYRDGHQLELPIEEQPAGDHYREWTLACRGEGTPSTPFAYAGPLTEAVLVGVIAGRHKDRLLRWDSAAMRFGDERADALVRRTYRDGWAPE